MRFEERKNEAFAKINNDSFYATIVTKIGISNMYLRAWEPPVD